MGLNPLRDISAELIEDFRYVSDKVVKSKLYIELYASINDSFIELLDKILFKFQWQKPKDLSSMQLFLEQSSIRGRIHEVFKYLLNKNPPLVIFTVSGFYIVTVSLSCKITLFTLEFCVFWLATRSPCVKLFSFSFDIHIYSW